jgi:hypothetical protein
MEPERSLPHSQESATCPYLEPNHYNPCLSIPFFKLYFYTLTILKSTPMPSKPSLSVRYSHQNPGCTLCHNPSPSVSSSFDHPQNKKINYIQINLNIRCNKHRYVLFVAWTMHFQIMMK